MHAAALVITSVAPTVNVRLRSAGAVLALLALTLCPCAVHRGQGGGLSCSSQVRFWAGGGS